MILSNTFTGNFKTFERTCNAYLRHRDTRRPLRRNSVKTDVASLVDVGMEDSSLELDSGRLERVTRGKGDH